MKEQSAVSSQQSAETQVPALEVHDLTVAYHRRPVLWDVDFALPSGNLIAIVGLMGAGKSTVGRRLAQTLQLPFRDADHEIEAAAGMSIPDIFSIHGEEYFRDGEKRVIARLLQEGPMVLATGGGAFMNEETRQRIAEQGISVWLRADLDVLMRRVRKRTTRPLLQNSDPEGTMRRLMETRHPVYATADLTVDSHETPHDRVVADIVKTLSAWLDRNKQGSAGP